MCVPYYSLNDSQQFSWDNSTYPLVLNQATSREPFLYHGKFCKTGLANRFFVTIAQCMTIDNIRLSNDLNTSISYPYECKADGNTQCIYRTGNLTRISLPCECGIDDSTGYCPLPNQTFMSQYINASIAVLNQSKCHTLDRNDIIAQKDCGIAQNQSQ